MLGRGFSTSKPEAREEKIHKKYLSDQRQIQQVWSASFTNLDLLTEAHKIYEICGLKSALEIIEKGKNKPEYQARKSTTATEPGAAPDRLQSATLPSGGG